MSTLRKDNGSFGRRRVGQIKGKDETILGTNNSMPSSACVPHDRGRARTASRRRRVVALAEAAWSSQGRLKVKVARLDVPKAYSANDRKAIRASCTHSSRESSQYEAALISHMQSRMQTSWRQLGVVHEASIQRHTVSSLSSSCPLASAAAPSDLRHECEGWLMMCVILERPTFSTLAVLNERNKRKRKKGQPGGSDVRNRLAWRICHPGSWAWPRR